MGLRMSSEAHYGGTEPLARHDFKECKRLGNSVLDDAYSSVMHHCISNNLLAVPDSGVRSYNHW